MAEVAVLIYTVWGNAVKRRGRSDLNVPSSSGAVFSDTFAATF